MYKDKIWDALRFSEPCLKLLVWEILMKHTKMPKGTMFQMYFATSNNWCLLLLFWRHTVIAQKMDNLFWHVAMDSMEKAVKPLWVTLLFYVAIDQMLQLKSQSMCFVVFVCKLLQMNLLLVVTLGTRKSAPLRKVCPCRSITQCQLKRDVCLWEVKNVVFVSGWAHY